MELLEGEALAEPLRRGPMSVSETLSIGLGMLAALSALHTRGIVHRDLKPSNVFITPHGVKLLDFGLARLEIERSFMPNHGVDGSRNRDGYAALHGAGTSQGRGRRCAQRSVRSGAILFEMLAGRPAFGGRNVVEVLHATLNEQPPALIGSPAVAAVDRVIRRALAKRPRTGRSRRTPWPRTARRSGRRRRHAPPLARPLTRLVVLPFRVLRPDPETDFLAFSLPDAIATSLSGIGSLIVRSSAIAARFGGDTPDLQALAAEADVDRVVMGTLLRSGDHLRAAVQLVEAPGGTLLTSHTVQLSLGDLFRLQDEIAKRVVEALSLPLAGAAASPSRGRAARRSSLRALPPGKRVRTHLRRPRAGA